VPVVLPPGTLHASPEQQSDEAVQTPPSAWHVPGAWQTPAIQTWEQQLAAPVQVDPFAAQVGPASEPASLPPPDEGGWHAYPPSSPARRQEVPAQQSFALGVQLAPICLHVEVDGVQKKPPAPGRHSTPLQH